MKKRKVARVLGIVVGVLLVLGIVFAFALGSIIRTTVTAAGPALTKTDILIDRIRLRPFQGECRVQNLVIGNPEGFNTKEAIRLGSLDLKMQASSVFTDRLIIDEILIDGPEITYELGLTESNIGRILANVESLAPAGQEKEAGKDDKKAGKKVQINHILIRNGKVRVSAKFVQGLAASIPLPDIELRDIGKEKDGATVPEAIASILGAIMKGVVACTGGVLDGAKAVGGAVTDGAKAVGGAAVDGTKAVGNLLMKAIPGGE